LRLDTLLRSFHHKGTKGTKKADEAEDHNRFLCVLGAFVVIIRKHARYNTMGAREQKTFVLP